VGRHVEPEGVELLGVPTGADARQHPVAADEAGELGEVPEQQRRVDDPGVGDERAEPEPVRQGGDGAEHHHRVVGAERLGPVARRREEQVVRQQDAVDAEGVEPFDPGPQPVEVGDGSERDEELHAGGQSSGRGTRFQSGGQTRWSNDSR
jgi:hypothetical protein